MSKFIELYRLFFEESNDALCAISLPEGRFIAVNSSLANLLGQEKAALEGESISLITSQWQAHVDPESRDRHLSLEMLTQPGFYNDIALQGPDNVAHFVTVKVRHVEFEGKTVALVMFIDDTERQLLLRDLMIKHQTLEAAHLDLGRVHGELKDTQDQMAQAAKLTALGELAAGISHELNQPLTGIKGFSQEIVDILKSEKKPSKKHIIHLSTVIASHADKMAKLLSHLRDFARKEKKSLGAIEAKNLGWVNLHEVTSNIFMLLGKQLANRGIQIRFTGLLAEQKNKLPVWAHSHAIEQILINLLTNARDAVSEKSGRGGEIEVSASESDEQKDTLLVRVKDNGVGIPAHIRQRIFDPFFTTKEVSSGMGLGLSISFGIARSLGGDLSLEQSSPNGTTFLLKLKRTEAVAERLVA